MKSSTVYLLLLLSFTVHACALLTDEAAFAYCLKNKNTYIVTLWPNVEGTGNVTFIERSLGLIAKIVSKKNFFLHNNGPFQFITKVYAKEQDRTGNAADNYRLARIKERQSFTHQAPIRIYLVQTNNLEQLLEV